MDEKTLIDELIHKRYEEFKGLPGGQSPIVRNNQEDDAFAIVALEILYKDSGLLKEPLDIQTLMKYIVAPPDNGIDIVVEHEDADENYYDFIQIKNANQTEVDIKQALLYMKRTVADYLSNKELVASKNLKNVLGETNFNISFKKNCKYIVVHRGELNDFKGKKEDEQIVTSADLETILKCKDISVPKVPSESFQADSFNNFIFYEQKNEKDEEAILCNFRGYDLAELANKYSNTTIGRNILFGQNLRDSLGRPKSYDGMKNTIDNEAERFWFYNNGITIVAEDYNPVTSEDKTIQSFELKNFSIINGAQTASSLGEYLKEAKRNKDDIAINKLKNVYVLTRILKVNNDTFRSNIAIFNNTQNPITTRDMAAIRPEQLALQTQLKSGTEPHIFVEIRRGEKQPINLRLEKHQYVKNELLAQLAFAGFKGQPFTAKDKKKALFDVVSKKKDDNDEEYLLNEYYHSMFHYSEDSSKPSEGILFKKSKEDINELLFVYYLYKVSKQYLNKLYKEQISEYNQKISTTADPDEIKDCKEQIKTFDRLYAINNICMFYCITLYYKYKEAFGSFDKNKKYKYADFYLNGQYKKDLIESFAKLYIQKTIQLISQLTADTANLNTWIRKESSEKLFLDKLFSELSINLIDNKSAQKQFIESFKE